MWSLASGLVRYFNECSHFMPGSTASSTGEDIFHYIDTTLRDLYGEAVWQKVCGFCSDGASNMTGNS